MKVPLLCVLLLCLESFIGFAEDGSKHSDECDISVTIEIDKNDFATLPKRGIVPFKYVVTNHSNEVARIADTFGTDGGLSLFSIDKAGKRTILYPSPKAHELSSNMTTHDLKPNQSFTRDVAFPLSIFEGTGGNFVAAIRQVKRGSSVYHCEAFTSSFSLPEIIGNAKN